MNDPQSVVVGVEINHVEFSRVEIMCAVDVFNDSADWMELKKLNEAMKKFDRMFKNIECLSF
jgi:hypothetical protein